MMHSVPKSLHGATLGKAHQWVRSITDTREYALENPSGERISLADLTNGSTKEVRVVGEVKQNPAHPAAFTGRSFGMNRHVSLTHILPEEVKPALVSSMVREQGLFGAVQSLSILMARPLKEFVPTSPMAEEILRATFYDYQGSALPLRNPAPIGFGRSYGGRLLGEEIAYRDAAMDKYVKEAIDKTDKIDLTEGEMKNFLSNSFVPYMLAAEANRRAISYIRRFIVPAAEEFGVRGKSVKREFDYMVKHMATDPADFYHGKEFAIVAHPGFLFPQFGPVVLPVPSSKSDKQALNRIDDLFLNAGNPPRFSGGTFARRESDWKGGKDEDPPVSFLSDYLVGGAKAGGPLDWEYVKDRMKKFDLGAIVRAFSSKIMAEDNVAYASDEGEFVKAFQTLKTKDKKQILDKASDQQASTLFVMDLHGMRPRPSDWPDALVLSAMEVLSKHREGISGDMTLIDSFKTGVGTRLTEPIEVDYTFNTEEKQVTVDFTRLDDLQGELETLFAVDPKSGGSIPSAPEVIALALKKSRPTDVLLSDAILSSANVSLGDIMAEAVSLAITKHGYESDADDIRFVTVLMIKAIEEMNSGSLTNELKGPERILAQIAKETSDKAAKGASEAIKELSGKSGESTASAYLALLAAYEAIEQMEVV